MRAELLDTSFVTWMVLVGSLQHLPNLGSVSWLQRFSSGTGQWIRLGEEICMVVIKATFDFCVASGWHIVQSRQLLKCKDQNEEESQGRLTER